MGLFSKLFGGSGSDKADKMRQQAIDAYSAIETPELKDLQVQLDQFVNAGLLTPEQAEVQLLNSNAFNDIAVDPSLRGAQKQALIQLQQIGNEGGQTATDKSRMADITDEQNALAKGRNDAILSNTKERGVGGSGVESVSRLINEQEAANRASRAGTDVAAQAEQRALQALQAAGQMGSSLEALQYGEEANKANSQNAIDLFNTQTRNANNLYNTQTGNQAQAANLSNAQNISNLNTQTSNTNKANDAAAVQQKLNNDIAIANGKAGVFNQWANDATAADNKAKGADMALLSGAMTTGATALGTAFGGPVGGAVASSFVPKNPTEAGIDDGHKKGYSEGGVVEEDPSLEGAYSSFVKKFCYGGSVKMADGGIVHIKSGKKQGLVPGVAPVAGDSPKNDVVDAKLSPGEMVIPRSVVQEPETIPEFVSESISEDPTTTALKRLKNAQTGAVRG